MELRRYVCQCCYWCGICHYNLNASKWVCWYKTCKLGSIFFIHSYFLIPIYVFMQTWTKVLHKYGSHVCFDIRYDYYNMGLGYLLLILVNKLYRHSSNSILLVNGLDLVLLRRFCNCNLCFFQKILLRSSTCSWKRTVIRVRYKYWSFRSQGCTS